MKFIESNKYREVIHNLIPGGAHTYSKGDDQFPQVAPAAIEYGKGAYVWDIDGNKFLDCSMGLTSVSLGHAFDAVNDAVKIQIDKGVNFQRPSSIEKLMAEKFLSLVPQHDMIKFGKNGSLVITAAVKLARAYTKRKFVAFPSDHPFYSYDDWFIGRSACDAGIPEENKSLSLTFKGSDINSLRDLFEQYPDQIACVITEPERCTEYPDQNAIETFLKEAINLTQSNGALFIQDEMITGFKTHFPGSISKYNTNPDMATWGKGIANGYSFCALTGKKEVMELGGIRNVGSEKVFLISTTHGGETSAIAAGLATIDIFNHHDVINHNHEIGTKLLDKLNKILLEKHLDQFIQLTPCPWMIAFSFRNSKMEICAGMRTLMMQEMISRGVLFQGAFVPCYSHNDSDVDFFSQCFLESIESYQLALDQGYQNYLFGDPAKPVFRKYL